MMSVYAHFMCVLYERTEVYLVLRLNVCVFLFAINTQTLEHRPLALLALVLLRLAKTPGAKHLTGSVNISTDGTQFIHIFRYRI